MLLIQLHFPGTLIDKTNIDLSRLRNQHLAILDEETTIFQDSLP